jgi:DNA modification methylase
MATKLIWSTEERKVNDLLPYSKNPRSISDKQMNDLKKSLRKFNLVEIPAIDTDGKIIAGHQRIKALQLLGRGEEEIEVRVPNRKLTQEEYDQYLITSNAVGGDWDFDKLKAFDFDLLLDVGFDSIDLAKIFDQELEVKEDEFDVEKEFKKIKKPQTRLGDLILLGKHRLICGNSGDPEVLKRLFGNEKASVIYSDPPYNIKLDYSKGIGGKQSYGGNVNDNRSYSEYKEFLRKSLEAALSVTEKNAHVFYWSDQVYIGLLQELYRDLGIDNKRVCLWLKNGQNPTPGVAFNKCYEPCTYGVRGKPYIAKDISNLNEVMNKEITTGNNLLEETLDQLDVWMVKRLSGKEYEHATSKPPKLHEKAIRRCTKPGDIILDSFSGSASTLIASEQLKRRVYAVELEPVFCDLAIKRFEKLTGIKAKIIRHEKE